jgi:hypothetical protein
VPAGTARPDDSDDSDDLDDFDDFDDSDDSDDLDDFDDFDDFDDSDDSDDLDDASVLSAGPGVAWCAVVIPARPRLRHPRQNSPPEPVPANTHPIDL